MDVPKNCWECKYSPNCHAPYYGGSLCKYAVVINGKLIQAILSEKPKG